MAINTAELESDAALLERTAAPTAPAPATRARMAARGTPVRRGVTERAATAKRRRVRVDWYLIGVLLLILSSGAVCLDRLLWAVQP